MAETISYQKDVTADSGAVTQGTQAVRTDRPLPVTIAGNGQSVGAVTYADASITSATGASQTLLAANTARKALSITVPLISTTRWVINPNGGTAVSAGTGMIYLDPGDSWCPYPPPTNAITGIGTTASLLTVKEGT